MNQERDARKESILFIAEALQAEDYNLGVSFERRSSGRLIITAKIGTEADYLHDAERILDSEIVRMARERIMERIRKD